MCCFEASVQLVPKSYSNPDCRLLELQLIQVQIGLFPSTALLENLVFPFRFRTNLRSKLSISYSTSKKLPTRRSISSVGSGAERTAMNVPKGEPGGNRQTTSPRVKKHLCPRTGCKRGQHSLSQYVLEVFSELKIS